MSYVETGKFAPGRSSAEHAFDILRGGSEGTEPYIATHNQILAHAATVKVYRTKYQVLFLLICDSFLSKFENILTSVNY